MPATQDGETEASIGLIGMTDLTTGTNSACLTSPASRPSRTADDNREIVTELKGILLTFVDGSRSLRLLVCSGLLGLAELCVFFDWFPIKPCQSKHRSER